MLAPLLFAAAAALTPVADHHLHAFSAAAAENNSEKPLAAVEVPDGVRTLLSERKKHWNDKVGLAPLFTEDSVTLDPEEAMWIRGPAEVAEYQSERFASAYDITPVVWESDGTRGTLVGYYTRPAGATTRYFGHVLLSLVKGSDGVWRIAAEAPAYKGPWTRQSFTAEQNIAQLDEAGIRKGALLSVAYWFHGDYQKVQAENDWMAEQVARYPARLVGFCSVDVLQEYAPAEIARCAKKPHIVGVKIHLGNSRVDLKNGEHVEKLRRVFRAANENRMAIVAHLWNGRDYGRADAEVVLSALLPEAPDVMVQIAHFAGGGPGYTDDALAVFADAIVAKDPRVKHLYFDVATVADQQTPEVLRKFAARIRQIGLKRVLFGSDSVPPNPSTRQSWMTFRTTVPLTDEEFAVIAGNVGGYLR